MTLYAIDGIAIVLADTEDAKIFSNNIRINNNRIIALVNAINIQSVTNLNTRQLNFNCLQYHWHARRRQGSGGYFQPG